MIDTAWRGGVVVLLLGLLAAAPAARAAAAPVPAEASFTRLLADADAIRTSERARFLDLVDRLEARVAEASPREREHLRFLVAARRLNYLRQHEEALAELERLQDEATDVDVRYRAQALAAFAALVLKRYPEAVRHVNQFLSERHSIRSAAVLQEGMNTAAHVYNSIGQHHIALAYTEETLASDPGPRAACIAGSIRLEALRNLDLLAAGGERETATVIDRCRRAQEPVFVLSTELLRARLLLAAGRPDAAEALVRAHMPEVERVDNTRQRAEFDALLSELLLARGARAEAGAAARRVIALGRTSSATRPQVAAHGVLSEIALAEGDPRSALEHYRLSAEGDRVLVDEAQAREMAYQVVRQETTQKAQQLEAANRQNELLALRQRVQQQSAAHDQLVIAMLALALLAIGIWAWRTRRMHASLRRLAETDMLTGVSNRRWFTTRAAALLAQAEPAGEDLALVMFDLDHFKLVNDRFGHTVGDWVLRRVAEACRAECGPADVFGRLGGEEFAILLPNATTRDARRVAEGCRLRLAGIDTRATGHVFRITASFGASGSALSGHDLSRLVSHADKMLYRAKREGRNRVFVYEVPDPLLVAAGIVPDGDAADGIAPDGSGTDAGPASAGLRRAAS